MRHETSNKTSTVNEEMRPDSQNYKWQVAATLMVVYTLSQMDRQIVNILLEPIKRELLLSDTQAGLLSGLAFAVFYVTMGIPIARWADRGNRVNIISLAVFSWSVMTALCGMALNFTHIMLARVGVAVGEAGCTPASHSLIADYFDKSKRSRAMAIFAMGTPLGAALGLLMGGVVNEAYGWRIAFIVAAIPGILIAVFSRLFIIEPRQKKDFTQTIASPEPTPISHALRTMFSNHSYFHLCLATSLFAFSGYALSLWAPSFLIRTYGVATSHLGMGLALLSIFGGGLGVLAGGWLGDKLALRDQRWLVWIPAIALVIGIPFTLAGLFAPSWWIALLFWIIPLASMSVYAGPIFGLIQSLMEPNMRAMAAAIFLLTTNLIGMGGGPLIVGAMSDFLSSVIGEDSLRYALAASAAFSLWGALHYYIAGRHLKENMAKMAKNA